MFKRAAPRTTGDPPSANGASSFHLWWEGTQGELLTAAAATIEVVELPVIDRVYFWALQASFVSARRVVGAAHLGLQWHPAYPRARAANWGGYEDTQSGPVELTGAKSPLPSALDNPNTRDFAWEPATPYRLCIRRLPVGGGWAWRGEILNLATGQATVVRDLGGPGEFLSRPVVWSEVFARCDHPSVTVRWSDFEATSATGTRSSPRAARATYQAHAEGGCDNTSALPTTRGVLQRTACEREVSHNGVIHLGG